MVHEWPRDAKISSVPKPLLFIASPDQVRGRNDKGICAFAFAITWLWASQTQPPWACSLASAARWTFALYKSAHLLRRKHACCQTGYGFQPPKPCQAMGTGMGTLIPTMPAWIRRENSRATLPSRVKQAAPLPNSWSLMSCTAVAKSGKRVQALGGAKNHMVFMPDAAL